MQLFRLLRCFLPACESRHRAHVKSWRHPQCRKYMTYDATPPEEDGTTITNRCAQKFALKFGYDVSEICKQNKQNRKNGHSRHYFAQPGDEVKMYKKADRPTMGISPGPHYLQCGPELRYPVIYGYKRIRNRLRWDMEKSPQNIRGYTAFLQCSRFGLFCFERDVKP